ncbi:MAG: amidohydrolase [Candidatus Thorarchaeota archaeon]|nr:amidohydrolase [Candidatus Thorarchaeota archaeon]
MKETAWKWLSDNESKLIETSDKIWNLAELGLVEYKSSEILAKSLEENGFKVRRGVAEMPTAFVASWGSGKPIIGVQGEYDALPGLSQKVTTHREPIVQGAPGHGCGHNIHGVSALGAAIAAKIAMEKNGSKGTIRFYGTPAEETYSGKMFMVRDGLYDDVDAVLSHHPGSSNVAGIGSSLAINSVKFHFHGVSSHAAYTPFLGKSALDAVELMNVGINFMREHIVQEARIHYVVEDGGMQPNVVPPYARSWHYVRAPEREQVDHIYEWVLKIADGADLMARTTHKVEFIEGVYNVLPNKGLSDVVTANMREIGTPEYSKQDLKFAEEISTTVPREDKIEELRLSKRPGWQGLIDEVIDTEIMDPWDEGIVWPGSTDVGDVSWVTPTMEFTTSTYVLGIGAHSWQVVACSGAGIGHKSLLFAAKAMVGSVIDLITEPEVLKKVQDEFVTRKAGRVYKSPVPKDIKPPLKIAREQAGYKESQ